MRYRLLPLLLAASIGIASPPNSPARAVTSRAEERFARLARDGDGLETFLRAVPKGGELHIHLAGAIPPDVTIDWALERGYYVRRDQADVGRSGLPGDVDYKLISPFTYRHALGPRARPRFAPLREFLSAAGTDEGAQRALLRERLTIQDGERWDEFPQIFARTAELMSAEALQPEIVRWVVRRAHAESVNYLELRINPFAIADDRRVPVPPAGVAPSLARAVDDQNRQWPADEQVVVRYVVALGRHARDTPARLPAAFQLAAGDDDGEDLVVGVDLVGPEELGPPIQFFPALRDLGRQYPRVKLTLHAGEMDRPNLDVRDSILLGATRIGHATNLFKDPTLTQEVVDTVSLLRRLDILIEVCLTSNELLVLPPRTLHPFLKYLRDGLPLSLNTDDGGIFDTDLTREFAKAVRMADLTWAQVKQLSRNSLQYSFAREADRDLLLRRWAARMEQFEQHPPEPPETVAGR